MIMATVDAGVAGAVPAAPAVAPAVALAVAPSEAIPPPVNGVLMFSGHGWGHGIGMSQWGAYGAATQGLSATQILDFYYPGTTPATIDPATPIRILVGGDDGVDLTVAPVAANGTLSFTDTAQGVATPLPAAVDGLPVVAWRAALVNGTTQLQGNWSGAFVGYPEGAPQTVTGIARFTATGGVVRVVSPDGTQRDLSGSADGVLIGGSLRTVETTGMDAMVPGVLGKELNPTWPTAALQAQAVAIRSYADFQVVAHAAQPFDVGIPNDFAYEGIARYDAAGNRVAGWDDPRLLAAVSAFPGDVRTSGGKAIFAMFASSDGGFTVARPGMPYLIAQPDPYDAVAVNVHHTWTANVPVSTLLAAYPTIGTLTSIVVNSRDRNGQWGGRTLSVTVNGTGGSVTDSGTSFYFKLGLQSNWWSLSGTDPVGALESVEAVPGGAQIVGWAYDAKTTAPIAVHLYVNGKLTVAVAANVDRPDLVAQLPAGTAHGFRVGLPLAPGTYSVCAYAINSLAGGANPQLGCANVRTIAGAPIGGAIVTPGIGGVQVAGWVLDPESVGPVGVRVTIDGAAATTLSANAPSTDPGLAAFPFYGPNHGFAQLLPLAGTHTVCLTAINVAAGADVSLACQRLTVYAGAPIGNLDAVVPSPGVVALWGWAIDPDTTAGVPVHLYVDGQLVAGVAATQSRPDVGAAFPVYGAAHGFSAIVPLGTGKHTVCAWALNVVAAGGNTQVGCKTVTVPSGDPVGHLDAVAYSGQIVTWGWAADPKAPRSPILVHIYVDGVLTTLGPAQSPRPDVATVFPAFGPDHGFYVGMPGASGKHQVCAFAINTQAGGNNPLLGCGTVVVP